MLKTIHVRDFGILGDVEADFCRGLICLTGETGAGKSLLVDAIKMILGARADATQVRTGAREALIEAVFDVSGMTELEEHLSKVGIGVEEGELRIRRIVTADGRGKAWIQDRIATARELREIGGRLVSVAGQHAFIGLGSPSERLAMLDAHARNDAERAEFRAKYVAWKAAEEALSRLMARESERSARQDYLEFIIKQIETLRPQPGEIEEISSKVQVMRGASRLKEMAANVCDALYEGTNSAFDRVGQALVAAREMMRIDTSLAAFVERLESVAIELKEVARDVSERAKEIQDDPVLLEALQERLDALKAMCRKYGGTIESVLSTLQSAREELETLGTISEDRERLIKEERLLHSEVEELAAGLSARRRAAAEEMSLAVTNALHDLAMDGATMHVSVEETELSETGKDFVEFMIETNKGEGFGPVSEIASGGELSRITLALYSVISSVVGTPVMIYDEIDSGLSGAVAERVGEVLAKAAKDRQILVVTHHGQIAARADAHYAIEKHVTDGRTEASIKLLFGDGRVSEIARMLGGMKISKHAIAHATELIEGAKVRKD